MLVTLKDEDGKVMEVVELKYIPRIGDQFNTEGDTHTRTHRVTNVCHTVSMLKHPTIDITLEFKGKALNEPN